MARRRSGKTAGVGLKERASDNVHAAVVAKVDKPKFHDLVERRTATQATV